MKEFAMTEFAMIKFNMPGIMLNIYFFSFRLISENTGNSYVCIADIKDHMFSNGQISQYW